MKLGILIITTLAFVGGSQSWAEAPAAASPKANEAKTERKSGRKKKVQICAECGKPEPECECPHAKEGKKEETKGHSETDGHKH